MVDEILRRLVKSVNTELEIKCKEATRAYFNLLHWNFPAGMKKNHENFRSACSTFYGVRATLAKFGPYAGNMKFNMHNEEWMYMYNSTCVSFHISTAKKYTSNNRKFLSKNAIHNKGKTVAVIFTKWIRNVICVSTTFYLGFDRERVEKVPPPPFQISQRATFIWRSGAPVEIRIYSLQNRHATHCSTICYSISVKEPVWSRRKT